jgi:hypothetical protein
MSSQNFSSTRKDDETIRLEILSNICRMMANRQHIDISKYCKAEYKDIDFSDINYNISAMVDDSRFVPMFKDKSDKNIYVLRLDKPFEDARSSNETFDGSKLVVSIVPQKVTDIKNSDIINDVLKTYPQHHKIFVIDEIVDKAQIALMREKNVEVFLKHSVTIDLMNYSEAPHRCWVDKNSAGLYVIKPNIARIHENDPIAKYFNAKVGDTLAIIRNTIANGFERYNRRVIDAKDVFGD